MNDYNITLEKILKILHVFLPEFVFFLFFFFFFINIRVNPIIWIGVLVVGIFLWIYYKKKYRKGYKVKRNLIFDIVCFLLFSYSLDTDRYMVNTLIAAIWGIRDMYLNRELLDMY